MSDSNGGGANLFTAAWGLATVVAPVLLISGLAVMAKYPRIAGQRDVAGTDLVIETLRQSGNGATSPFRQALGWRHLDRYRIRFQAEEAARRAGPVGVGVVPRRGGGFRHVLAVGGRPVEARFSALRHFSVTDEDRETARQEMAVAYPEGDPAVRQAVQAWGLRLFQGYWNSQAYWLANPDFAPRTPPTEEELRFCVWLFVQENLVGTGTDVTGLGAAVRRAFPGAAYDEAMKWAAAGLRRNWGHHPGDDGVPPAADFTCWLALARVVGLDEARQAEAMEEWLTLFQKGSREAVLRWGKQLRRERRDAGEPCPPCAEDLSAVLCVMERVFATDDYGQRCKEAVKESLSSGWDRFAVTASILMGAYPNDDVYLLLYSLGATDRNGWAYLVFLVPPLFVVYLCWLYVDRILGERILGLERSPIYQRYKQRRAEDEWLLWGVRLGFPLLAWQVTLMTLPPQMAALVSPNQLLIGTYATTFVAGQVLEIIAKLVGYVQILVGDDPDGSFRDEWATLALAIPVLWYFEADLVSMSLFAAAGFLPNLVVRSRLWLERSVRAAPPPPPARGPAGRQAPPPLPGRPQPPR